METYRPTVSHTYSSLTLHVSGNRVLSSPGGGGLFQGWQGSVVCGGKVSVGQALPLLQPVAKVREQSAGKLYSLLNEIIWKKFFI